MMSWTRWQRLWSPRVMDNVREKAIEAAMDEVLPRNDLGSYCNPVSIEDMRDFVGAYERVMLEAGRKMVSRAASVAACAKGYAEIRAGGHAMSARTWRTMWDAMP
ncbi:MAG: hypothetical protein ACR2Q4_14730, partial [Geminicoccaceae bacterium]